MRGATECAKRLKLFVSSLRSKLGKVRRPIVSDPITQLILGILSRDTPETKAHEGLDRLRSMVVDYNELRVIPPIELAQILGDFPDARLKCEDIARALNKIFMLEHAVSLDRLAELPKKELMAYLAQVDGLEPYTWARIRLLGLGQRAVPLDEAMWALARREQIVAPRCPLLEAQQFLEHQIAADDALDFVALLKKQAWSEMGNAVKRGGVERILSVPPDRTSRHMLHALAANQAAKAGEKPSDEGPAGVAVPAEDQEPPARAGRAAPSTTSGSRKSAAVSSTTSRRGKSSRKAKPAAKAKTAAAAGKRGRVKAARSTGDAKKRKPKRTTKASKRAARKPSRPHAKQSKARAAKRSARRPTRRTKAARKTAAKVRSA